MRWASFFERLPTRPISRSGAIIPALSTIAHGQTVAMGEHMPVHLGAMPLSVDFARQAFRFAPGDVVILNDPFRGGTHLPDITAVSGVFLPGDKSPSFYLANRAHHADVGGMSPGSMPLAQEIFQEGIRIPPMLGSSRAGNATKRCMESDPCKCPDTGRAGRGSACPVDVACAAAKIGFVALAEALRHSDGCRNMKSASVLQREE